MMNSNSTVALVLKNRDYYTRGGGVLLGILGGGVPAGSSNPDHADFRPKNVIIHKRFQTRPLQSIPVFRPGLEAEIMLSLLK